MTMLFPAPAKVKTTRRSFAEGITDPTVTVLGVEMTPARRDDINDMLAGRPGRLERDVRRALGSVGYTGVSVEAALAWVEARGVLTGCPVIDLEDVAAVNLIVARHAAADDAPEPEPVTRPWSFPIEPSENVEVRSARYEATGPSLEDELWYQGQLGATRPPSVIRTRHTAFRLDEQHTADWDDARMLTYVDSGRYTDADAIAQGAGV